MSKTARLGFRVHRARVSLMPWLRLGAKCKERATRRTGGSREGILRRMLTNYGQINGEAKSGSLLEGTQYLGDPLAAK